MAYHLLWRVGHRLTQSGAVRDGSTLRRLLPTHSAATTRLPLTAGRGIEVRKPSRPDAAQALVYHLRGIASTQACPARKIVMNSNLTGTEIVPN